MRYTKNTSGIICLALCLCLILCGCGLSLPKDTSYTQIADPTLEHIVSGDTVIYQPEGSSKGKIFLDPGHGFSDPGVLAPSYETDGVCESEIVFEISKKLLSILVADGYEVMMCRESDYDIRQENEVYKIQPEERTEMANSWGADLFISLHLNSYEDDPSVNYLLCSYTGKDLPDDTTMDAFCNYLFTNLTAMIGERTCNTENNKPATGYYVNTKANMPSVLMELGFITNAEDCVNFTNSSWQQICAQGIANGIAAFLASEEYSAYALSLQAALAQQ